MLQKISSTKLYFLFVSFSYEVIPLCHCFHCRSGFHPATAGWHHGFDREFPTASLSRAERCRVEQVSVWRPARFYFEFIKTVIMRITGHFFRWLQSRPHLPTMLLKIDLIFSLFWWTKSSWSEQKNMRGIIKSLERLSLQAAHCAGPTSTSTTPWWENGALRFWNGETAGNDANRKPCH